jgi:hypothetical protein
MLGMRSLKSIVWLSAIAGGLLGVAVSGAQEPNVARPRSAAAQSISKPAIMRPPAVLSAERPDEGQYEIARPEPVRLSGRQTSKAAPLMNQPREVGSGVRQAAYQALDGGQPYYTPGTRGQRMPATVGMPAMSGQTMTDQWPGGGMMMGQEGYDDGGNQYYQPQGYATPGYAPCNPACDPCCSPPPLLCFPQLGNLELLAGVQGFTGSLNRGSSGSFGFHEGAQIGMPLFGMASAELGVLTTQSNFDGSALTADDRQQLFLTAGGFRRVDWGLQGGLVFDYLHDEWDYSVDVGQLRGELSYVLPCGHDVGAWFTAGVNDAHSDVNFIAPVTGGPQIVQTEMRRFDVDDLFAFFYRRQFACGGEGRLFGGFTSESEGLIGGDFRFPINPCWAFEADFLYVAPNDTTAVPAYADETWNVSMQVVWTPWSRNCGKNYDRPLLGVANNGSFVTKLK